MDMDPLARAASANPAYNSANNSFCIGNVLGMTIQSDRAPYHISTAEEDNVELFAGFVDVNGNFDNEWNIDSNANQNDVNRNCYINSNVN
jgi:hypothetical protein